MNWSEKIFGLKNEDQFKNIALEIFRYQAQHNSVYALYLKYLGTQVSEVKSLEQIPFLPIEFFKTQKVVASQSTPQVIFTSSGTTGDNVSRHYVTELEVYENSFLKGFQHFYGPAKDYCFLALLPSYLERKGSSLIYMMEHMIRESQNPNSGFYLNNHEELINTLNSLQKTNQKIVLLGVSFALLDLVEKYKLDLSNVIVMETGGMKGRREEITREELHATLCNRLGVNKIHSEYGMTELLSQAYSKGDSLFKTPPWMKILIRDTYDPFSYQEQGLSGGVNIIDLANINSCAFIETKDLGRIHPNNTFEIMGRFDHSDIRGCNLLVNE